FTDDDLFYIRGFGASHPLLPSARSFSLNLANASEDSCTGSTEAGILYREFIGGVNIMRSVEVFDMVIADFAVRAARQHETTGDYVVLVVMVTADVIAQYDDSQVNLNSLKKDEEDLACKVPAVYTSPCTIRLC
ncbi:PREDICTED: uncharacterized protein LOC106812117, partial [Priapulus caudatus]|uniref:Uncharacterized protein LOC106812117 n=1 Tax=Priapulus caudatus TaxID=37621 RepID=A0ABM1EGR1_PRICU